MPKHMPVRQPENFRLHRVRVPPRPGFGEESSNVAFWTSILLLVKALLQLEWFMYNRRMTLVPGDLTQLV